LSSIPFVVDLDGTLIRTDLLLESGFAFIRAQPLRLFAPIAWLVEGKAHLKTRLAECTPLEVKALPYDMELMELLAAEKAKGREIILATASHRRYAEQIAAHLQIIDRVIATESGINMAGTAKRDALVREFGDKGFDYAGNAMADLPVWAAARHAYVVNPDAGVEARARAQGNVERVMSTEGSKLRAWRKALRLHQWAKNLLIFVPLLASHHVGQPAQLWHGLIAFFLFGLCASSVYLLNDLLDLSDDRHHSSKRMRPFASGQLSLLSGILAFPVLLALAFIGSRLLLPPMFTLALLVYYGLTLAYSLGLKRIMALDVIVLALLYTLRLIAGTFAFDVNLTFWMLAFSMFIFLSLALVKRFSELREARVGGVQKKARGRGYYPGDLEMVASLGASSGYLAVMVLALYIQDPATVVLYHHPRVIWMACPILLFWISRIWMLAHRGEMHEDPVVFAMEDRVSLLVGAIFGCIFWLAS
jgi:4-hydroxybenzoate polyprenyltransferase